MTYASFHPTEKTLMGPGPSNVHPRVLEAMARPIIGHLDPDFVGLMDEIKVLLRFGFQTQNALTFPVSAPGSAGMETCFVNLVEPGDKVVVCMNGVFGGRMKENIERCGGLAIPVVDDWGRSVETSTGVWSDAETLASLANAHGCMTIMDSVTGFGGIPIYLDEWGIDAVYSGSQKCLSCPPGLSPVSFSSRAINAIQSRKTTVQSWFLDLSLVMNYWAEGSARAYHHTAPINAMYALHESLVLLHEEGLENAWSRHVKMHEKLRDGLEDLGFSFLVSEGERLPQLNAVFVPESLRPKEADIRAQLLKNYNLEIGAGLGALSGKIWRIGLMGYGASDINVERCLFALGDVIKSYN